MANDAITVGTPLSSTSQQWRAYDQWIELDADNAAYTAASPENALVLIGPNRAPADFSTLHPIGLLQNFTVGQNINWQAQQMIGSGRTFFLAGKAPGNGSITRLFTSSSTLLGAIYKVVVDKVTPASIAKLESVPYDLVSEGTKGASGVVSTAGVGNSGIMFTLDSELLKIPVGMACLFRDTVKNFIGGFYIENLVIPNLNFGFAVGQPAIFETVNLLFDRVVPFDNQGGLKINQDNVAPAFAAAISSYPTSGSALAEVG